MNRTNPTIANDVEELDQDYLNLAAQDILLEEIAERSAFLYQFWEDDELMDETKNKGQYDQELVNASIEVNLKYKAAALSGRSASEHTKVIRLYKILNSEVMENDFKNMAQIK